MQTQMFSSEVMAQAKLWCMKEIFTQRLARLMREAGHSQASLADAIDKTQPTIGRWIKGSHTPNMDDLENLSEVLNVSLVYLAFGVNPDSPQETTKLPLLDLDDINTYLTGDYEAKEFSPSIDGVPDNALRVKVGNSGINDLLDHGFAAFKPGPVKDGEVALVRFEDGSAGIFRLFKQGDNVILGYDVANRPAISHKTTDINVFGPLVFSGKY